MKTVNQIFQSSRALTRYRAVGIESVTRNVSCLGMALTRKLVRSVDFAFFRTGVLLHTVPYELLLSYSKPFRALG